MDNTNKQFIGFLTCLLFCAGCIEYEESLIIKKNGSGTITMAYGMPLEMVENDKSFSAEKIKNDLRKYVLLKNLKFKIYLFVKNDLFVR